ncbi:hypothetical protein PENSPDRAFT_654847 [Peniophora sp. CONT]|nr:hypothetical protein PENSPDRAFT_654847 [Peniophora sp. CONT]
MSASPTTSGSAHPLLYAALTPINCAREIPHIELYKPKTKYSLGRNPQSDIVLDSPLFEWSFCNLLWDGRDEVRIEDLSTVNGIWINRRRLAPGESRILREGDLVFLSICELATPEDGETPPPTYYDKGDDHAYIYHQYTDRPPPLPPLHQSIWVRLDRLGRARRRIEDELARLEREREAVMSEEHIIFESLPEPPTFVRSAAADSLQETLDKWEGIRKQEPFWMKLPEDFRELCRPDTDPLPYAARWRDTYSTCTRVRHPPLPWGPPVGGWTQVYHRSGWPDWNNPDLVWGGVLPLDQSRPLTIPPSIIYWSAKYKLPVYAHPRFDQESTRVYARPYAQSHDGFTDYSAALQRRDLELPPMEDPPIIRPRCILASLGYNWCPNEDVLAEKVASLLPTLRPDDDDLLPDPSTGPALSPKTKTLSVPPVISVDSQVVTVDAIGHKRKREAEDEDEAAGSDTSRSSPLRPSLAAGGNTFDEGLASSPKRRKISAPSLPLEESSTPLPGPSLVTMSDISRDTT